MPRPAKRSPPPPQQPPASPVLPPQPVRDMINLRIMRHDREQVLADCDSLVIPASGEVLQLDTLDVDGEKRRPSTLWRVVSVTLHVPSLQSSVRDDGTKHRVQQVDVEV